jgi:hypothetical protein
MERNTFDSSRVLTASARRSACISLTAALAIALGSGCIDVSAIRSNIGDGSSPAGYGGSSTGYGVSPAGENDAGPPPSMGVPCGKDLDCTSAFCADGYCCDQACQGPCTFCGPTNLVDGSSYSGAAGHCTVVPAGALDPHGTCAASTCVGSVWTPAATCDGAEGCVQSTPVTCASGACNLKANGCTCRTGDDCPPSVECLNGSCGLRALGALCGADSECASDHCVESVCCESSCGSGCQTCSAAVALGRCVARPVGARPRDPANCPTDAPDTCGLDGTCDGSGACRYYIGSTCVPGTCAGNTVFGAFSCDGTGRCMPSVTNQLCLPYSCDATTGSCFQACTNDAQCDAQHPCDLTTGSCGKAAAGAHCNSGADCPSGLCVDDVCCSVACEGGCVACNLPGRLGSCAPIDAGKPDPRGVCLDHGSSTCGPNGTCDGVGGCASYALDTQCLAPSCESNLLSVAGSCDGSGTCRPGNVINCYPFRCVDGVCTASCESDDDCTPGNHCLNGSCGAKGPGQSCVSPGECASNNCVDGVCCDSACTGTCQYCAFPSSQGHCTAVTVGNSDPRGVCTDYGAGSCATNGKCDSSGGCARYDPGTVCASESCAAGLHTPPSTCDVAGHCINPAPLSCFPYACGGAQCFSSCAFDAQCALPAGCFVRCLPYSSCPGSCGPKSNGASCSSASECTSSICSQGICCNSGCTGPCQSCALSTSLGTCADVPPRMVDPSGSCVDQGAPSCGTDGRCDGNHGCETYPQGTACLGQSCQSGSQTLTAASFCDGAGNCVRPNPIFCAPFQCGATACKNACASDADCVPPATCNGNGSCGVPTQEMVSR